MKTQNLLKALEVLEAMHPNHIVTSISFEDGSGKAFNYVVNGISHFIRFK